MLKKPGKKSSTRDYRRGHAPSGLIGQRIVTLRPMTKKEAEQEGWPYHPTAVPTVIVLESGDVLFPAAANPDGRSVPAHLIGNTSENKPFVLVSVMERGTKITAKQKSAGEPKKRSGAAIPHVIEMGTSRCPG